MNAQAYMEVQNAVPLVAAAWQETIPAHSHRRKMLVNLWAGYFRKLS